MSTEPYGTARDGAVSAGRSVSVSNNGDLSTAQIAQISRPVEPYRCVGESRQLQLLQSIPAEVPEAEGPFGCVGDVAAMVFRIHQVGNSAGAIGYCPYLRRPRVQAEGGGEQEIPSWPDTAAHFRKACVDKGDVFQNVETDDTVEGIVGPGKGSEVLIANPAG
jgi:hypothetical protein